MFKVVDAVSAETLFLDTCTKLATGSAQVKVFVGHLDPTTKHKLRSSFHAVGVYVSPDIFDSIWQMRR